MCPEKVTLTGHHVVFTLYKLGNEEMSLEYVKNL